MKHKYEIADQWDQAIVEESLHKRQDVRVTVGADGDGIMALIKEVSRKRGVAYLPLPPYSYITGTGAIFSIAVRGVSRVVCGWSQPLDLVSMVNFEYFWSLFQVCRLTLSPKHPKTPFLTKKTLFDQ